MQSGLEKRQSQHHFIFAGPESRQLCQYIENLKAFHYMDFSVWKALKTLQS